MNTYTNRVTNIVNYISILLYIVLFNINNSKAQATSYIYDNLNRLTQVQYSNGSRIIYTYDANGNRLQQKISFTPAIVPFAVKCFVQGYYSGVGNMSAVLMNQGVSGSSPAVTDSITVALHHKASPYNVFASFNGVMLTNGTVQCNFPTALGDNQYYIVLKHRNGIETWSSQPQPMHENGFYDFTTSASQAYGSNQVEVSPGVFAFYSGDINQDENIDLGDMFLIETDISNYQFGYFSTDINGDGNVDLLDQAPVENNINNFIYSIHP